MEKILSFLMILIIICIIYPPSVHAQDEAGHSAMLKYALLNAPALQIETTTPSYELQKTTIKNVLERNHSPLTEKDVDIFMQQCTKLEMNCYLVPAISGVESGFCNQIARGTNNCWGWGGGYIVFNDYKDGIKTVSESLKSHYIDHGALTVEAVGRIYAASPTWAEKVNHFLRVFEAEQQKNQLLFASNPVK